MYKSWFGEFSPQLNLEDGLLKQIFFFPQFSSPNCKYHVRRELVFGMNKTYLFLNLSLSNIFTF